MMNTIANVSDVEKINITTLLIPYYVVVIVLYCILSEASGGPYTHPQVRPMSNNRRPTADDADGDDDDSIFGNPFMNANFVHTLSIQDRNAKVLIMEGNKSH